MEPKTINNPPRSRRARSIEGLNSMGESNIYERNIATLIKQIHEAEKKNEENKNEKKSDKQTQNIKIKLTPINNQTIQYILSLKLRTPNMLTILREFLSNMKFLSVSTDDENRNKLLYSLSFCLKMEKKSQGTIIFRYGNKGTRFYIVLGGEVSVLILRESTVEMTFLNYIRYLLFLKVLKEDELAKKIISANPKSTFRLAEKDIDIYYDNIVSFINKYYTIVYLNESDIIEYNKNESNNKNNIESDGLEDPKGLYDYNNNLIFESIKNKKITKHYTLEGENKLKSSLLQLKAKNSLLLNIDDNKENQNSDSDKNSENSNSINEEKKEPSEKNVDNIKLVKFDKIKKPDEDSKEKDISKEEKPMGIKYKATKKIPNYLELDICTFGPNDISRLVNFVIKGLETFYSKTNKVHNVEEYIRNCAVHPSLKLCDKYTKKEKLTVFQYFEITKKKEGDIFGELALQHNDNKRTGTMIATKDLVLGYLSKNDYNNCLRGVEMKKRKIEVNFIMSFSLFDEMNWVNFEKTYFNFLKKENLTSGQVIINQNEKFENIYFIMEGQIEITTNLTFMEISTILKQKNKKIKNKKKKNRENEENNKQKICSIDNNYDNYENNTVQYNSNYYYNRKYMMNSNEKDFNEMTNKKDRTFNKKKYTFLTKKQIKELEDLKCFRLCVIDNKDILGLDDICLNEGVSFVKAICTSSNAVVFSLKKSILDELKRKNSEIEKNLKNITIQREKIMIERLKLTSQHMFSIVKKNKVNMKEVHKDVEILDIKNKDHRVRSAIYSKYIPKINIELSNTISSNYKSNSNTIKNLFKKGYDLKKLENNESINSKNIKFHNLKKNLPGAINYFNINIKDSNNNNTSCKTSKNLNLLVDSEWDKGEKNNTPSLMERKSCFQKFMESVTDRFSQIRHDSSNKYTNLFAPLYKNKNKKGENNKKQKINIKFNSNNAKDSNLISENFEDQILNKNNENNNKTSLFNHRNSISLIKTNNNNFVLVNKSKIRLEDKETNNYKLAEYEIKDDSLKQLLKSQKHIVKHQYTLSSKNLNNKLIKNKKISIITPGIRDPTKLTAFSELSKKYHLENKLPIMKHQKTAQFNPLNYMKIILGTRYKEHETSTGEKKFSKMLIENRHLINKVNAVNCYSTNDFKNNNCINTFFKSDNIYKVKPSQVDLLLYNKTIEKNSGVKFRNFSNEQENKRRIFSRNIKRRTKTTCFTRTLTKSVGVK